MPKRQPDKWAKGIGHAVVGVAAAALVAKFVAKSAQDSIPLAIFSAIVAILLHDAADAPVAQALSDLGI
jgi:hypothetical protein